MTDLTVSRLLDAGPKPAPGGWRSALYRPDAPGAVLDGQEWAASWPAFMRAVDDPWDSTARQYIANAMSERLPGGGGFLVPETLRSQVLEYMSAAIVRPQAMVLPMTSERLTIPVLDNLTQASEAQALGGLNFSWTEESAGIMPSIPSFAAVTLEARKAAAYMQGVSNEFVADASGAFGDFCARVIGLGYQWFEDDTWINGTGVGEPQGLINAPCAVAVTRNTGGSVLQVDIASMFKSLHPAAKMYGFTPGLTSVRWLISATVMDQILEMYFAIGTPTNTAVAPSGWFQAGDGDKVGPNMLGLPVTVTDHQPAAGSVGDVILADLAQFVIADRMAMTIERSTESPGAFGSDTSNFRIKSRLDGRYWVQSSTTTEAAQHVSPVVVLH